MTASYWEIGRRIVEFKQGGEGRAAYGEASADLSQRFGPRVRLVQPCPNACVLPRILQTPSAKFPDPPIVLTPSAISAARQLAGASGRNVPELGTLAQAFPLPLVDARAPAFRENGGRPRIL
jgi:hypothetical protein